METTSVKDPTDISWLPKLEDQTGPSTANPNLEKIIAAICLKDKESLENALSSVQSSDFTVKPVRLIWDVLKGLRDRGQKPDQVTIRAELEASGNLSAITTLDELAASEGGDPAEILNYCRSLKQFTFRRNLSKASDDLHSLSKTPASAAELTVKVREIVGTLEDHSIPDSTFQNLQGVLDTIGINKFVNPLMGEKLIDTPFDAWNDIIIGFCPHTFNILAGRTSHGKSALAGDIARYNAKKGVKVAYYSLEMTKAQLFLRMACAEAGVSHFRAMRGDLTQEERKALLAGTDKLRSLPLFISDEYGHNIPQILSSAKALRSTEGLDLVVIDHIQLMEPVGKRKDRREGLVEITKGLKKSAKELGPPLLVVAQIGRVIEKREGSKREPGLADLSESASIEQDCDTAMLMDRPAQGKKDGDQTITHMYQKKNRVTGRTGGFDLKMILDQYTFTSLSY